MTGLLPSGGSQLGPGPGLTGPGQWKGFDGVESGGAGEAGWLAAALHDWTLLGKAEDLAGWCPWRVASSTGRLWGKRRVCRLELASV